MPVDLSSPSHRWLVDEDGLEVVKNHYSNYPKDPNNPIDRWHEFKVEQINYFNIDFGGIYHTVEPHFSQKIYGIEFEGCVTHIPIFIEALDDKFFHQRWKVWRFNMWNIFVVLSRKTRNHIKKVFESKKSDWKLLLKNYDNSLRNIDKVVDQWNQFFDEKEK